MATIENGPARTGNGTVSFALRFPKHTQRFEISREALDDLEKATGSTGADLLIFFQRHEKRIIQLAEKKYGVSSNGVILLKSVDFA